MEELNICGILSKIIDYEMNWLRYLEETRLARILYQHSSRSRRIGGGESQISSAECRPCNQNSLL
jgi:hypothetical protein